jgi:hypothetical protein
VGDGVKADKAALLKSFSIDDEYDAIAKWDPPKSSEFEGLPRTLHREVVVNICKQLTGVIVDYPRLQAISEKDFTRWLSVVERLCEYFVEGLLVAIKRHGAKGRAPSGFIDVGHLPNTDFEKFETIPLFARNAVIEVQSRFAVFLACVSLSNLVVASRDTFSGHLSGSTEPIENIVHRLLTTLVARSSDLRLRELAHDLGYCAVRAVALAYPETGLDVYKSGPFSAIKLNEFSSLARRDDAVVKRYGQGRVAKVFEHQIALIMQSLGAMVIQTRPGTRTVDLLCIPADGSEPLIFLVEAKTTKRAYGLPVADQRALKEYVRDTQRLTTLPPLRFVLVVAPEAGKQLGARIRQLEIDLGVPVRFLASLDLVQLRESVLLPFPFSDIVEEIVKSPHVIPEGLGERISEARKRQQEAHEAVVKAMMPSWQ